METPLSIVLGKPVKASPGEGRLVKVAHVKNEATPTNTSHAHAAAGREFFMVSQFYHVHKCGSIVEPSMVSKPQP